MSENTDNTKVTIGGKEYELIKTGYDQAVQISALGNWLGNYGLPVLDKLGKDGGEFGADSNSQLFSAILVSLTPEALVTLFDVIIGCGLKDSKQYFDITVLIESIEVVWDRQVALRNLVNRFFSSTDSTSLPEETSTQ